MSRAVAVLEAMKSAIEAEIEEEAGRRVAAGEVKVEGMTFAQIGALRAKFMQDTGLPPEKLTPAQILYKGDHE